MLSQPVSGKERGSTPMHMAAATGHLSVFRALLAAAADVNAVALNRKGEEVTPMDAAARGGGHNKEILLALKAARLYNLYSDIRVSLVKWS